MTPEIPEEIASAARRILAFFNGQGIKDWQLFGIGPVPPKSVKETCMPVSIHTCPTCGLKFAGADERFCPKCHEREHNRGPLLDAAP